MKIRWTNVSVLCWKVTLNTPTVLFFHEWTAHTRHWFYLTANLLIVQNKTRIKLYRVTFLCVSAEPDGSSVKRLSAWEPSWGFVRADTLPLCALHTQVWEAVCRCGSQLQRERGGRVTGARSASCRELWELRGGELGNLSPLPKHTHRQQTDTQTDGEEIRRKIKTHLESNEQERWDLYHRLSEGKKREINVFPLFLWFCQSVTFLKVFIGAGWGLKCHWV